MERYSRKVSKIHRVFKTRSKMNTFLNENNRDL